MQHRQKLISRQHDVLLDELQAVEKRGKRHDENAAVRQIKMRKNGKRASATFFCGIFRYLQFLMNFQRLKLKFHTFSDAFKAAAGDIPEAKKAGESLARRSEEFVRSS